MIIRTRSESPFSSIGSFLLIVSVALIFVAVGGQFQSVSAQGLAVTPKRVILNDGQRHATIRLLSKYDQPMMFRLQFIHQRMTEHGKLEQITSKDRQSDEMFVDNLVRFAPRQVKIDSGEAQTVRLLVRKPDKLEAGEYRSHLLFRSVTASDSNVLGDSGTSKKERKLSAAVKMRVHVAIPVIVRHGTLSGDVDISLLELAGSKDSPVLKVKFKNTGQRTTYGKLTAKSKAKDSTKTKTIGGVETNLYASTEKRIVEIPLDGKKNNLDGTSLIVSYKEDREDSKIPEGQSIIEVDKEVTIPDEKESAEPTEQKNETK